MRLQTKDGQEINAAVCSELMENHLAATAVDESYHIAAVVDANGDPMLFSIGSDRKLYLIVKASGSPTGWAQTDLAVPLGSSYQAAAFAVSQAPDGRINLAVAVQRPGASATTVYVTPPLSNAAGETDWQDLAGQWVERPATAGNFVISEMMMGANVDGKPIIVATGEQKDGRGFFRRFFVNGDAGDRGWSQKPFPIPENAIDVLDMAIGVYVRGRLRVQGCYLLYQVGSRDNPTLQLAFSGEAPGRNPGDTIPFNFELQAPPGATALASLATGGPQTDLYAAGEGVFYFPAAAQSGEAQGQQIVAAGDLPSVRREGLHVCRDDGKLSLWALSDNGTLYYTTASTDAGAAWSPPLPIRRQVARIAALRNKTHQANELFLLKESNELSYLWQDPATTVWRETQIPVYATGSILTLESYTSHIRLTDAQDRPLLGKPLRLSADAWSHVIVNGRAYAVSADTPAEVYPDLTGTITIINRVGSLASPTFRLEADFLQSGFDVYPATSTAQKLQQIQSGSDLANAKKQDGTPLIAGGANSQTLDTVAKGINMLAGTIDAAPGQAAAASAPASGSLAIPPQGTTWSAQLSGSTMSYSTSNPYAAEDCLWCEAGAALEALKEGAESLTRMVITAGDKVLDFFIEMGGQVYRFAVDELGMGPVFEFIGNILSKVGAFFQDVFQWLAFLFNWDDILATQRVFSNVVKQSFDYGISKIDDAKAGVGDFFDDLTARLDSLEGLALPAEARGQRIQSASRDATSNLQGSEAKAAGFLTSSPQGNYSTYQTLNGGVLNTDIPGVSSAQSAIEELYTDVLEPGMRLISTSAEMIYEQVQTLFSSDDLTPEEAQQVLCERVDDLKKMVGAAKDLVIGLLDVLQDILDLYKDMITQPVPNVPVLGPLLKKLFETDENPSLLDILALLQAIPATVLFKAVTDKAPFGDNTYGLDTGNAQAIFVETFGADAATVMFAQATGGAGSGGASGVSGGALRYSQVGGVGFAVSRVISTALGVAMGYIGSSVSYDGSSYKDKDAVWGAWQQAAGSSKYPVPMPGLDQDITSPTVLLAKFKLAFDLVSVVSSYPIAATGYRTGIWIISAFSAIGKNAALIVTKGGATKTVGGVDIAEGFVTLVLNFYSAFSESGEERHTDEPVPLWVRSLLNSASLMAEGGVKLLPDPNSKFFAAVPAIGISVVNAGLGCLAVKRDVDNNRLHRCF